MRAFALSLAVLAVMLGAARSDDTDPEPSVSPATPRHLTGKWTSVRRISAGMEADFSGRDSYSFAGEKVTYDYRQARSSFSMSWSRDSKRPFVLTMTTKGNKD